MSQWVPGFNGRGGKRQTMVLFGTPSFSGGGCEEFHPSFIDTLSALASAGIASATCVVPRDPYLSKARNRIATEFLTRWATATHLFFLDDDIGWPGHKVVEFIQRDLDLLAGVYPKKNDQGEFPCQLMVENERFVEKDGLLKAMLAPTGFMCVKRHVIEKLAARSGQYLDTTKPGATEWQFNVFDMGFFLPNGERPTNQGGLKGEFWGEDYYFVRKWRDAGGEVWIDPDIEFTHRGSKAWRGNLKSAILAAAQEKGDERKRAERVEYGDGAGELNGQSKPPIDSGGEYAEQRPSDGPGAPQPGGLAEPSRGTVGGHEGVLPASDGLAAG